ncbi:hypothetical protein FQN60_012566, partial [Etheostoma spectabile]
WFSIFFETVRPELISCASAGEDNTCNKFFISSTGRPIYNASNDLSRFQKHYNCPKITSQAARRAFETAIKGSKTSTEQGLVATYLSPSNATADKHYRMTQLEHVSEAFWILKDVARDAKSDGEPSAKRSRGVAASYSSPRMDEQTAFDLLTQSFPVTISGPAPKKRKRSHLTGTHDRSCYDKRLPTESRLLTWMASQEWTTNCPNVKNVLSQWRPQESVAGAANEKAIFKLTKMQKWTGLVAIDIPGKGKGVVTSRPFHKNEVVCDYHGNVVTRAEGRAIHKKSKEGEMGYMFFFKDAQGVAKCIDATTSHCK